MDDNNVQHTPNDDVLEAHYKHISDIDYAIAHSQYTDDEWLQFVLDNGYDPDTGFVVFAVDGEAGGSDALDAQ